MSYYKKYENYISDDVLKKNIDMGVNVHDWIFLHNTNSENIDNIILTDDEKELTDQYELFIKIFKPIITYPECSFKNERRRIDFIAEIDGKKILVDVKTYSALANHEQDIKDQLRDYKNICIAHGIEIDECRVLWLQPNKMEFLKVHTD